jgi:hypothetical protein
MTTTAKLLIPAKQAENAQTTQFTSSNARTVIAAFTVTNTTAGAQTISVNLVPNGGSAGASNLIVSAKSVAAGETVSLSPLVSHVLESGGFISTIASAATSLTIRCSGLEIT